MGSIWVREFTGGLDTRKMPETTPGGALIVAQDCHLDRGGDIEKRQAFVPSYALPGDLTEGLAFDAQGLVVFGSTAGVTPPAGVRYQRLVHPIASTLTISRILSFDRYAGKIYVVAEFSDGSIEHYYDGTNVSDWYDGRARASFAVVSGAAGGSLTSLKVNAVNILNAAVAWNTDTVQTAADIAASINAATSAPDYAATSVGNQVNIVASLAGANANGRAVSPIITGTLVFAPASGLKMAGGADSTGTFTPGDFVKTIGSKIYSTSGSALHFSGIQLPTQWTTDAVGAGFIDMATVAADAEDLKAVARYQQYIAIFASRTTLIYYVDPDPTLNKESQVLANTGTVSGKSVTQFGDADLFYCDASGLRSLRARDASNAAATSDIGVPIDTLVVEKLRELSDVQTDAIIGLIEPDDGRFWLIMADTIYVFSYFPGSKVSAWSTYVPSYVDASGNPVTFNIDYATVYKGIVYVRSGDEVFAYGGMQPTPQYDAIEPVAWLPYLDGDAPSQKKNLDGIDVACEGLWEVSIGTEPTNLAAADIIGRVFETTYNRDIVRGPGGESTHFSLRFVGKGDGPKKIASATIHYSADTDAD